MSETSQVREPASQVLPWIERNQDVRATIMNSGVTTAQIDQWEAEVESRFVELAARLPSGHAWGRDKLLHGQHARKFVHTKLADALGLNELERRVIGFMLLSHDIGRLEEAFVKQNGGKPGSHGLLSANIIAPIIDQSSLLLWPTILLAIEHHSDMEMSTFKSMCFNRAALALTWIIRDLDKLEGFRKAPKYINDPGEKERQRHANWPDQIVKDPTWGRERQAIMPADALYAFVHGKPIDRTKCESYEAFMLQLLGWLYDVVNPEIRDLIIAEGWPARLMEYLREQLANKQPIQLERIESAFAKLCPRT